MALTIAVSRSPLSSSYLQSKGILCLADEVQAGFGRSGTHFWAFESYEEGNSPSLLVLSSFDLP